MRFFINFLSVTLMLNRDKLQLKICSSRLFTYDTDWKSSTKVFGTQNDTKDKYKLVSSKFFLSIFETLWSCNFSNLL